MGSARLRTIWAIWAGFGLTLLWAGSASVQGAEEEVCIFRCTVQEGELHYYVLRDRLLAPGNAWDPERQTLPVDLQNLAEKARAHLIKTKDVKEGIRLCRIQIKAHMRVDYSGGDIGRAKPLQRWYAVFNYGYDVEKPEPAIRMPPVYRVVALFDGTIADERRSSEKR